MNELVRAIALYTFGLLNSTYTGCMTPLPAVFTLQHSGIYVCTTNYSNKATNIEFPIDETLGIGATLHVPYINPDNGHI